MNLRGPRGVRRRWMTAVGFMWVATVGAVWVGTSDLSVDLLRRDLEGILVSTGWHSAEWGVLAVSLDTGDTLFAHAPGLPLTPASNVKLVTTAAALHYLGPDFRWETYLLADGEPVDGVVRGDLVLFGTGDPGLPERYGGPSPGVFDDLAAQLRRVGVREVRGDVVGDGSFFEGPLLAPRWDPADLNDSFAAPVGALAFNENVVTLRIEASPFEGLPPVVHTMPEDPDLPVANEALTGPGRLFVQRDHPSEPIRIVGSAPRGGQDTWRRITVRDPNRFAARAMLDALEEAGIEVTGAARGTADRASSVLTAGRVWSPGARVGAPRVVARHRSAPLRDYVALVNKESHNLTAEATLKTLGRILDGEGSFEGGSRVLGRFLREEVGADSASARVVDGSGLSDTNRLSPGLLVAVIQHMAESDLWEPYWQSLPEAGNRRELGRMYRTAAAGNLRAKTGTISGVSALSGVVRSVTGERIAFSIVGNRVPSTWNAKRVEDRLGVRLAAFDRPLSDPGRGPTEIDPTVDVDVGVGEPAGHEDEIPGSSERR